MSTALDRVNRPQLIELERQLSQQLEQHRAAGLKLDLTRGKSGTEQLASVRQRLAGQDSLNEYLQRWGLCPTLAVPDPDPDPDPDPNE